MHIYKGAVFLYYVVIFYYSNTLQFCHEYIFEKKSLEKNPFAVGRNYTVPLKVIRQASSVGDP